MAKKKAKDTNVECRVYRLDANEVKKENAKQWNRVDKSVKKREKQLDEIIKLLKLLVKYP